MNVQVVATASYGAVAAIITGSDNYHALPRAPVEPHNYTTGTASGSDTGTSTESPMIALTTLLLVRQSERQCLNFKLKILRWLPHVSEPPPLLPSEPQPRVQRLGPRGKLQRVVCAASAMRGALLLQGEGALRVRQRACRSPLQREAWPRCPPRARAAAAEGW